MVLHELTHAWDHQRRGYSHPDVLAMIFPFTRAQLELHDPAGYAAVEAAWELR